MGNSPLLICQCSWREYIQNIFAKNKAFIVSMKQNKSFVSKCLFYFKTNVVKPKVWYCILKTCPALHTAKMLHSQREWPLVLVKSLSSLQPGLENLYSLFYVPTKRNFWGCNQLIMRPLAIAGAIWIFCIMSHHSNSIWISLDYVTSVDLRSDIITIEWPFPVYEELWTKGPTKYIALQSSIHPGPVHNSLFHKKNVK